MPGSVFLLAPAPKRHKNCAWGVCGNMSVGSPPALGAGVFGKNSSHLFRPCAYRHLFYMVAVSTLCSGQFDWMAVAAGTVQKETLNQSLGSQKKIPRFFPPKPLTNNLSIVQYIIY